MRSRVLMLALLGLSLAAPTLKPSGSDPYSTSVPSPRPGADQAIVIDTSPIFWGINGGEHDADGSQWADATLQPGQGCLLSPDLDDFVCGLTAALDAGKPSTTPQWTFAKNSLTGSLHYLEPDAGHLFCRDSSASNASCHGAGASCVSWLAAGNNAQALFALDATDNRIYPLFAYSFTDADCADAGGDDFTFILNSTPILTAADTFQPMFVDGIHYSEYAAKLMGDLLAHATWEYVARPVTRGDNLLTNGDADDDCASVGNLWTAQSGTLGNLALDLTNQGQLVPGSSLIGSGCQVTGMTASVGQYIQSPQPRAALEPGRTYLFRIKTWAPNSSMTAAVHDYTGGSDQGALTHATDFRCWRMDYSRPLELDSSCTSSAAGWQTVWFEVTLPAGVSDVRFRMEKGAAGGTTWVWDEAVLMESPDQDHSQFRYLFPDNADPIRIFVEGASNAMDNGPGQGWPIEPTGIQWAFETHRPSVNLFKKVNSKVGELTGTGPNRQRTESHASTGSNTFLYASLHNPTTVSGVGISFTAPGTITRSSGDFTADGWKVGDWLLVSGSVSNNQDFTDAPSAITAVGTTTLTVASGITTEAESSTVTVSGTSRRFYGEALKAKPTYAVIQLGIGDGIALGPGEFDISVTATFNENTPSADTITRTAGSFVTDGLVNGDVIFVKNSASNDAYYHVQTVAALTLTLVAGDDLAAEGPVAVTIRRVPVRTKQQFLADYRTVMGELSRAGIMPIWFALPPYRGDTSQLHPCGPDETCGQVFNKINCSVLHGEVCQ